MRFEVLLTTQVVTPHGCVNDHHAKALFEKSASAGLLEVALPVNFPSKAANGTLAIGFRKQLQRGFNGRFLGAGSARLHGLAHEPIVDFNVCSHGISPCVKISCLCV